MTRKQRRWYRTRNYLHFDEPIGEMAAEKIVTSPKRVAKHAFFPLIHYQIESYKLFQNKQGELEKKLKTRDINYACHLDSHIYAYYCYLLTKKYEEVLAKYELTESVLAFRSLGKSNIEFANSAFNEILSQGKCSAIGLDIRKFFDNLDHCVLKKAWSDLLEQSELPNDHYNVFKSLTKFSYVEKIDLYTLLGISKHNPKKGRFRICTIQDFRNLVREEFRMVKNHQSISGIPQGTPISAVLSNIYMLQFDIWAKNVMEEQGGKYYRYCDDMLFITKREFRNDIEKFANREIEKLELELNTDKTEIRDFWMVKGNQTSNLPLQYLGFTFDGKRKLIRSAALARYSNRMKRGVKLAKNTKISRDSSMSIRSMEQTKLYRRKLYERYSHLGRRNFITYGHRAANEMKSKAIRKQLKPLWNRLIDEIEKPGPKIKDRRSKP